MDATVLGVDFRMKILYSCEGNWSTKGPKVKSSTSPRGTGGGGKSDIASGSGEAADPAARENMRRASCRVSSRKLTVDLGSLLVSRASSWVKSSYEKGDRDPLSVSQNLSLTTVTSMWLSEKLVISSSQISSN